MLGKIVRFVLAWGFILGLMVFGLFVGYRQWGHTEPTFETTNGREAPTSDVEAGTGDEAPAEVAAKRSCTFVVGDGTITVPYSGIQVIGNEEFRCSPSGLPVRKVLETTPEAPTSDVEAGTSDDSAPAEEVAEAATEAPLQAEWNLLTEAFTGIGVKQQAPPEDWTSTEAPTAPQTGQPTAPAVASAKSVAEPAQQLPADWTTWTAQQADEAYGAEIQKWKGPSNGIVQAEELAEGIGVPSNESYILWTGHGSCTYAGVSVNWAYERGTLYIFSLTNELTEPVNFVCTGTPAGGTSAVNYRYGERPDPVVLSALPLKAPNHCGVDCTKVIVVEVSARQSGSVRTDHVFATNSLATAPTATPAPTAQKGDTKPAPAPHVTEQAPAEQELSRDAVLEVEGTDVLVGVASGYTTWFTTDQGAGNVTVSMKSGHTWSIPSEVPTRVVFITSVPVTIRGANPDHINAAASYGGSISEEKIDSLVQESKDGDFRVLLVHLNSKGINVTEK